MLNVGLAAMPSDPQWNWRFPHRHQYPEDTRHFTRQKYREFLEDKTGRWQVMMVEGVSDKDTSPVTMAMAVWDVGSIDRRGSQRRRKSKADSYVVCSQNRIRRDGDPRRMQAWTAITAKSKAEVFDSVFGPRHIHLQILATHPKYQRRGAGRALCEWGVQLAERIAAPITVFASPMGSLLYRNAGFISVEDVKVQAAEDNHEGIVLAGMTLIPQSFASALEWRQAAYDQSLTSDEEREWKWR